MLVDQIESWVARKLGRPDPHASVFEKATDRMPTPFDFWALKDVNFEIEKCRRGPLGQSLEISAFLSTDARQLAMAILIELPIIDL